MLIKKLAVAGIQLFIVFSILCPSLLIAQNSKGIRIEYNSGESKYTNYAYLYSGSAFQSSYVRIDDKKGPKINIQNIDHVEGVNLEGTYKYFAPIWVNGIPIWGERTFSSEHIDLYYTNIVSGTWNATYNYKHFQYRKDGGSLQKMKASNLLRDVGQNQQSMDHIRKGRGIATAQTLLYLLGSGLVIAGIIDGLNKNDTEDSGGVPPVFIGGAITLFVPWFLNSPKQKHYQNALKAYE